MRRGRGLKIPLSLVILIHAHTHAHTLVRHNTEYGFKRVGTDTVIRSIHFMYEYELKNQVQ